MAEHETNIILASNEYSYVQNIPNGIVKMYVGPTKFNISNTDRLIDFNPKTRRFVPIISSRVGEDLSDGGGVKPFIFVESSQYVVIENPTKDPELVHKPNYQNEAAELDQGKKIVKSGPAAFPLWPGQVARVIDGHRLREDEYLITRVYDAAEGEENQIGKEAIVKGTETRFFIPETRVEVVADDGEYVRKAVKPQDAEYCVLLKPDGTKRFVNGPAVVFPEAGEEFVTEGGTRVFKAEQLRKERGLHLYVTKDFSVSGGGDASNKSLIDLLGEGEFRVGQELFVHGKEGLFFPTENLEVKARVSPVSLSESEGLYVRNLVSGEIKTVTGPKNCLLDPTKEEIVRRDLEDNVARLYGVLGRDPKKAVAICVPPNNAALVTSKDKRSVVRGPKTQILDHNEDLEVLKLSTGKPKTDDKKLATAFLQVEGNKVSDIVTVETNDQVNFETTVSYRISFTGEEPEKWFDVNDYVGLLCDHLSSVIRASVKSTSMEDFYLSSTEIIRSSVLGAKGEGKRTGKFFKENGMNVYDLEVLNVEVLDRDVAELLYTAQRTTINTEMNKKRAELDFSLTKEVERIKQETLSLKRATLEKELAHQEGQKKLDDARAAQEIYLDRTKSVGTAENRAEAARILSAQESESAKEKLKLKKEEIEAEAAAFKEKMGAVSPHYVAALTQHGHREFLAAALKEVGAISLYENSSVENLLQKLIGKFGLNVGDLTGGNGDGTKQVAADELEE